MAIVTTDNQHYSDIAAAIRAKTGDTAALSPGQMAAAIAGIPGVAVRQASGTFQFSGSTGIVGSNYADVDVGFYPDVFAVYLSADTKTYGRTTYRHVAAAAFFVDPHVAAGLESPSLNKVFHFVFNQTPLAGSTKTRIYGFDWGPNHSNAERQLMDTSLVWQYVAYKFTE